MPCSLYTVFNKNTMKHLIYTVSLKKWILFFEAWCLYVVPVHTQYMFSVGTMF